MKKIFLKFTTIISFIFLFNCTKDDTLLGGGGTETGNAFTSGVTGIVQDSANRPVIGAKVYIYPVDHIPSVSAQKLLSSTEYISDNNGRYYIPDVLPGTYNIDAKKDSIGVFIDSVKVAKKDTVTKAPDKKMKKFGRISGVTRMPGQSDTNQVRMTIFIPGTRRITLPNIGGKFSFDEMPEGKYKIIFNPTLQDYNVKIIDTTLKAGQSLNLDTVIMSIYEPDTIDIYSSSVYGAWGPNKVYRIFNSIDVQSGMKLRISEGTQILFMGTVSLTVHGSIVAKGSLNNPIIFKHGFTNASSNWGGISSELSNGDSTFFQHCIIDHSSFIRFIQPRSRQYFEFSNSAVINSHTGLHIHILNTDTAQIEIRIFNNVFTNISFAAINLSSLIEPVPSRKIFYNNIFTNSSLVYELYCGCGTTSGPALLEGNYNCFHNNARIIYSLTCSNPCTGISPAFGNQSILENPLFETDSINPYSFKLSSNSPCKGTGINGTDMGIYSTYKP